MEVIITNMKITKAKYVIRVRDDICSGCLACVAACSTRAVGYASPSSSRVHIDLDPFGKNRIKICRQCPNAPCVRACPQGAITRSNEGVLIIDYNKCDGCRKCIEVCPFDAIFYDRLQKKVVKCDLCSGALPACVDACPTSALSLIEVRVVPDLERKGRNE